MLERARQSLPDCCPKRGATSAADGGRGGGGHRENKERGHRRCNCAYNREMQKQSDKEREKGKKSQNELQNAQATIANAQSHERAHKASQDLKNARLKIQMQNNDLMLQVRAREEAQGKAKAMEKELRDALQNAKERAKKAEYKVNIFHGQLRDEEKELEKERDVVKAQKQTMPACTPGNRHTPPKRKSPTQQQQRQHPFHEDLASRQQQSNGMKKHVHFQQGLHSTNAKVICMNADDTFDCDNGKSDRASIQKTKTN